MSRELEGYRDEMAFIIERLGYKGFYSTAEIAELDFGPAPDAKTRKANQRTVRARYNITESGLTISSLARKRVLMS